MLKLKNCEQYISAYYFLLTNLQDFFSMGSVILNKQAKKLSRKQTERQIDRQTDK